MKKNSRMLLVAAFLGTALLATLTWNLGIQPVRSAGRPDAYDLRSLKILARTALYIQGNYLDQEKVEPKKMLLAALEKIEWLLPEVVVVPAPGESEENPAAVRVSVGKASTLFDIGNIETLWSMRDRLKDIVGFIQDNLQSTEVEPPDVEYAAINGLLSTLDPHSVLLDPDTYREMKVSTHGEFGGLGIVISIRDHELTIISPLEDTPAWRAGLKAQDRIVQIEDESTINMRLDDAVELLRGKVGTQVTIWVKRKGWNEAREYKLRREKITIKSVTSKLLANGIGYIRLKNFQGHSQEQIRAHLDQMRTELGGELKGLILDLRGNPGGLLEQAIKISDLFLDSGTIVLTVGKGNTVKEEHKASWSGTEKRYPMAVLVGPGSASASEIVAGALQNNDRAVIVGSETFGKGSVQVLYDMDDGSALKLTIAQYLTPGEVSIQGVGIQPDIGLRTVNIDKRAIHYYADEHFGEGDLDSHLTNDAALHKKAPAELVRYFEEMPPEEEGREEKEPPPEDEDAAIDKDFAVGFAQGLLAQARSHRRNELLQGSSGYIDSQRNRELEKISSNLARLGVDWSQGKEAAGGKPILTFSTDRPEDKVRAGEKFNLRARVKNTGSTPLYRIRGVTRCENSSFEGLEFVFGRLLPGEEKEWVLPVEVSKQEESQTDEITLDLLAGDQTEPLEQSRLLVEIEEIPRPHFAYSWQLLDDKGGNGDGLVQRGEKMEMLLIISNQGPGKAQDVHAMISNQSGEGLFLEQGRQKIESIEPGARAEATFRFQVKRKLNEEKIKLQLDILDTMIRTGVEEDLEIPLQPDSPKVKQLSGNATATARDVELRSGAHEQTQQLGTLKTGRSLPVLGSNGRWLKLDLGQGRHAWAPVEAVKLQNSPHPAHSPGKEPIASEQPQSPPKVVFDAATQALKVTQKEKIRMGGEALDNLRVKDLYLYVQHRDGKLTKSRKLAFLTNDSRKSGSVPFSAEVNLVEGLNTLVVVARDDGKLTTVERWRVLRLPAAFSAAGTRPEKGK